MYKRQHIARAAGFAVRGDFGLNIVNSRAMRYLREQGLDSQLLSFEDVYKRQYLYR